MGFRKSNFPDILIHNATTVGHSDSIEKVISKDDTSVHIEWVLTTTCHIGVGFNHP